MKFFLFTVTILLLTIETRAGSILSSDSLRIEARNGRQFIIHLVDAKETLFGISRRYRVTIDEIAEMNPTVLDGLKIGQEITIPWTGKDNSQPEEQSLHFVDIGETLYSISKKYEVSVEQIIEWNDLPTTDLDVGQQLVIQRGGGLTAIAETPKVTKITLPEINGYHIVAGGETLFAISVQYGIAVEDLRDWNNLEDNNISIGQRLIVSQAEVVPVTTAKDNSRESTSTPEPKTVEEEKPVEITPIEASNVNEFNSRTVKEGNLEKTVEEGLAMVISNSTNTKKYLALHRTAPVGTVMRVKNLMNNLTIYVRVVGKLPDTGENNRVLLKLSRTAFERLDAIDRQFPVEVSYIP